jgi:hypothetical protein
MQEGKKLTNEFLGLEKAQLPALFLFQSSVLCGTRPIRHFRLSFGFGIFTNRGINCDDRYENKKS